MCRLQGPASSAMSSGTGGADQHAAQAEADMTEAGDVGEWLGMDSSRQAVAGAAAANGPAAPQAVADQRHRLSKSSSSGQVDEVHLHVLLVNVCCMVQGSTAQAKTLQQLCVFQVVQRVLEYLAWRVWCNWQFEKASCVRCLRC